MNPGRPPTISFLEEAAPRACRFARRGPHVVYTTYGPQEGTTLLEEACLAARVRRIHRAVVNRYDRALQSSGVTVAQLDLLATILELGDGVQPAELARNLGVERSTLSRNARRLEALGLVRIEVAANGRDQTLRVTSKGRKAAIRAFGSWSRTQAELRAQLGSDGVTAIDLLVHKLVGGK